MLNFALKWITSASLQIQVHKAHVYLRAFGIRSKTVPKREFFENNQDVQLVTCLGHVVVLLKQGLDVTSCFLS